MSFFNKGSTGVVVIVTSENGGGNFTFRQGVDDPAVAIENAWSYLNDFGGGTLVTKGAGETWQVSTRIDSQGDDVTWISDWGLKIQAPTDLANHLLQIKDHDRVTLDGLYLDHNHPEEEHQSHCVYLESVENLRITKCRITQGSRYGIDSYQTLRAVEIDHCWVHDNRWNNITLGTWVVPDLHSDINVHHNLIEETSDVGLSILTEDDAYITINNNIIRDVNHTEGYNDAGWGLAIEGATSYVKFCDNIIYNCDGPAVVTKPGYDRAYLMVTNNLIYNCGNNKLDEFHGGMFLSRGTSFLVDGNTIVDSGYSNGQGIRLDVSGSNESNDIDIKNNKIIVTSGKTISNHFYGIYVEGGDEHVINNNTINIEPSGGSQRGILLKDTSNNRIGENMLKSIEDYGIYLLGDSDNNCIIGNYFVNVGTGLILSVNTVDDTFVHSNDFYGCTIDVSNSGTGTCWGSNRDQNGNFDQGVEP